MRQTNRSQSNSGANLPGDDVQALSAGQVAEYLFLQVEEKTLKGYFLSRNRTPQKVTKTQKKRPGNDDYGRRFDCFQDVVRI
jgi:hypothetical protein